MVCCLVGWGRLVVWLFRWFCLLGLGLLVLIVVILFLMFLCYWYVMLGVLWFWLFLGRFVSSIC